MRLKMWVFHRKKQQKGLRKRKLINPDREHYNIEWNMTAVNNNEKWGRRKHKKKRQMQTVHRNTILWHTGPSRAVKTTMPQDVDDRLHGRGYRTFVLDWHNKWRGPCNDLGFSDEDRKENVRRIGKLPSDSQKPGSSFSSLLFPHFKRIVPVLMKGPNLVSSLKWAGSRHCRFVSAELQRGWIFDLPQVILRSVLDFPFPTNRHQPCFSIGYSSWTCWKMLETWVWSW